jgi:hypothetical protein
MGFKILRLIPALAALALVASCHDDKPTTEQGTPNVAYLAAHAEVGLYADATLAVFGSFEWNAAPLHTHAASIIRRVTKAVREGTMTVDAGQMIVDQAKAADDLVKKAELACLQDDRTAKCKGNEAAAKQLLEQAKLTFPPAP